MEDNNETSRANLEGLPTEVFQMIAGNLSRKQLKRVRLVSRWASARVFYVYKNKLFSDYGLLLFDQESQALKVAKDPEFGGSIKRLSIFCSRPGPWPRMERQNRSRSLINQAVAEADAFEERGGPLTSVTTFLCYLKQHGRLQQVDIAIDDRREHHLWGDAFYTTLGRNPCPKDLDYNFEAGIRTAIEALSLSKVQILKFTTGCGMGAETVSATIFNPDHCLSAFQRLESLSLGRMEDISDERGLPYSDKLLFLQRAQQLRNLNIVGVYEFPHALLRAHLPLLENVTIKMDAEGGLREGPRLKDLIDFVKSHANLVSFNLNGVDILSCRNHFRIDDEYREANDQDAKTLQQILGVPGTHKWVFLWP